MFELKLKTGVSVCDGGMVCECARGYSGMHVRVCERGNVALCEKYVVTMASPFASSSCADAIVTLVMGFELPCECTRPWDAWDAWGVLPVSMCIVCIICQCDWVDCVCEDARV